MQIRRHKRSRDRIASDAITGRILVDLANLREDGIDRFRTQWDKYFSRYSNEELLTRRDELQLLWSRRLPLMAQLSPNFTDEDFQKVRKIPVTRRTQSLYEGSEYVSQGLEEYICEHWLYMEKRRGWIVQWGPGRKKISANPRCLPVLLAVGCVGLANRLGVCRNRECPAPYYLLARRDQRFCSSHCAGPSKKAAKLKWWHEHRGGTAGRKIVPGNR
jgi:hypothetical protein